MSHHISDHECLTTGLAEVGQLEALVRDQLHGRVRDLRLEVEGRGVVLRGRAPTYYVKQLAQHAVMQATALSVLANHIEVNARLDPVATPESAA